MAKSLILQGLYLRVIIGDVSVPRLVSIDPEELKSPALSSAIEIPVSRIKVEATSELSASAPKTETNAAAASGSSATSSGDKGVCFVEAESEVDKILGVEPVNTTAMHRFHLFDLNCDICTGKKEREYLQKKIKAKEKVVVKTKPKEERTVSDVSSSRAALLPTPKISSSRGSTFSAPEVSSNSGSAVPTPTATARDDDYDDNDCWGMGLQMDDDDERSSPQESRWRAENRHFKECK
ncbi:unnamed protein product [Gongylonema pulchrum]|uniref:Uncharacterized protein n=1 Tax=Gongylonema pulchrum TaxID=637853 RepID=A0A183E984_9BILA|nr:unnamed protein product [Gongylonema pulchrum]